MSLKFIKNVICILCVCYLIFLGMQPLKIVCYDYDSVAAYVGLLQKKLIEFKHETGYFPKTLEVMKCMKTENRTCVNYMATDGWEHEFIYIYPAKYGNLEFDLYSKGADGKDDFGKNDDISNWNGISYWIYNKKLVIDKIIIEIILFSLFICFLSLFIGKKRKPV
ncbi:MAG: type II secretion system protein GspG [Thiotrichaceae bacterium]|nr:type II secretion system protein GspG [Thiotrichaceae bacterium]